MSMASSVAHPLRFSTRDLRPFCFSRLCCVPGFAGGGSSVKGVCRHPFPLVLDFLLDASGDGKSFMSTRPGPVCDARSFVLRLPFFLAFPRVFPFPDVNR